MNRNIQNTLLYSIIVLVYATLFVPLIVSTSLFFPYITGKAFTFRLLVELATLLYIALAVLDRSFLPKRSAILGAVVVFTAVLGISTLTAESPSRSFWSNFERMEGYVTIAHLFFFFLITTSVFQTKRAWYAFLNTSLAISICLGLVAFADYTNTRGKNIISQMMTGIKYLFVTMFGSVETTVRIAGPLGNSSYLGGYALVHTFIAGLLLMSSKSIKKFKEAPVVQTLYILAIIFNIIVLYNTGTRGSFVGLIAGLFIATLIPLALLFFGKSKFKASISQPTQHTIKKVSIATLVALILVVGLLGINKNSDFVKSSSLLERFSSLITLDIKSVLATQGESRTLLWGMSWNGVKERPLLGWGQDNFPFVFAKYYDPKMYAQEQWFDRTHNVFFDWLIAAGFIGLLSYLGLFVVLLYVLWKKTVLNKNNIVYDVLEKSVLTGLLVAYFVHNFFIFDNLASYILFFVLLAYVNQRNNASQIEVPLVNANSKKQDQNVVANTVIILVAVLGFGYVSNEAVYKPYMAGKTLISALQRVQPDAAKYLGEEEASPKKILELFEKALGYNTFANTEIRERLAEVTPTLLNGSKDTELVTAFTTLMANEYQQAIKETPKDPRPYMFLSLYLQKFGLFKEALVYMDQAIALSPTKQSFLHQKGIIQISMKEFTQASETFKKAYELETESKESRVLYALSLIYVDKFGEAKKILDTDITALTDERILNTLLQKNMYKEIEEIGKLKIENDPTNPQVYLSLAGLYLKQNRRNEAIAQIRKVIELAPEFKETGEYYIREIQAGRDPSAAATSNS